MIKKSTFEEAAEFVYGPEWRGKPVFVYWGPNGGQSSQRYHIARNSPSDNVAPNPDLLENIVEEGGDRTNGAGRVGSVDGTGPVGAEVGGIGEEPFVVLE